VETAAVFRPRNTATSSWCAAVSAAAQMAWNGGGQHVGLLARNEASGGIGDRGCRDTGLGRQGIFQAGLEIEPRK
jgi:hypothetical protein